MRDKAIEKGYVLVALLNKNRKCHWDYAENL